MSNTEYSTLRGGRGWTLTSYLGSHNRGRLLQVTRPYNSFDTTPMYVCGMDPEEAIKLGRAMVKWGKSELKGE